jgi:hypothetical protein
MKGKAEAMETRPMSKPSTPASPADSEHNQVVVSTAHQEDDVHVVITIVAPPRMSRTMHHHAHPLHLHPMTTSTDEQMVMSTVNDHYFLLV